MCVDPYSGQKKFKTSDIPLDIRPKNYSFEEKGAEVIWENDIPGFESHVSFIPREFLSLSNNKPRIKQPSCWQGVELSTELSFLRFDYEQFVENSVTLARACQKFQERGIIFVTGVPESEQAVETIANCIGCIYNSFYGKTWDVMSMPQAHNVAYTSQPLGLHQDLLYMADPPGIQLLHCIENTASGGESLFSDGFQTLLELMVPHRLSLHENTINYHYNSAGEDYRFSHKVFTADPTSVFNDEIQPSMLVNYSPPFQAPFRADTPPQDLKKIITGLGEFAKISESPKNIFEYKLGEGECVIFNNRRILHGRRAFNTLTGKRWLKGCYVTADSFRSRLRILSRDSK
ncbi:hypothetical protein K3495_g1619 [Podosphaera aphanis]|nr:hypothetical protein K3495_g1619 [Podosphaera aphanis]